MKEWVISVVVSVFLFNLLGLLLPENNLSKFIKKIFAVLMIFVVIQPLYNLKNYEANLNDFNLKYQEVNQENYLDYVTKEKIEYYKKNCLLLVKSEGATGAEIEIFYDVLENYEIIINKAEINLKNSVINSDKEHIDIIDTIKTSISEYLAIEKDKVVIYV